MYVLLAEIFPLFGDLSLDVQEEVLLFDVYLPLG